MPAWPTAAHRRDRPTPATVPGFYEFFAGGGMVRAGLGPSWSCLFANDVDPAKAATYHDNWGSDALRVEDVGALSSSDLPGRADLAWASFPCQDLSLAGQRRGLSGERSGTFHAFWDLMAGLAQQGRAPRIVAIENVCGTLTARAGADFATICRTFAETGYRFGALVIDAALFVPQSRPRLFIVGVRDDLPVPDPLIAGEPVAAFHTPALGRAIAGLPPEVAERAVWWALPVPPRREAILADLIDDTTWHTAQQTLTLMELMSPLHRTRISQAMEQGGRHVGSVFRRTRADGWGGRVQRAEVRFDGMAGCLRTPGGGSSRQSILIIEDGVVRSRLISPRETARLMGLDEDYRLPLGSSRAYHLTGDGVVVPVVRHLARHLFEPILDQVASRRAAA